MELRVLNYFLAIAREESITQAAKSLHLSQPTLSKQIKDLEDDLGKQLLIRGSRKVMLTEEGMLLKKRAEEILTLVDQTESEVKSINDDSFAGDVTISAGETRAFKYLARAAYRLKQKHNLLRIQIVSGDVLNIMHDLDEGIVDFGMIFGDVDRNKFNAIQIPCTDKWGVLMRKDDPLSQKENITPEDLLDKPLLFSRQSYYERNLPSWFENYFDRINRAGFYSLAYNASILVEEKVGYAIVIDGIIGTGPESSICFRPLEPQMEEPMLNLIWKKYRSQSKTSRLFLDTLEEVIAEIKE